MENEQKLTEIDENWSEIRRLEERVRELTGDPAAGFNADSYFFGVGFKPLGIKCTYRKKRKDGMFTEKWFETLIYAKFCSFTGKPLYK